MFDCVIVNYIHIYSPLSTDSSIYVPVNNFTSINTYIVIKDPRSHALALHRLLKNVLMRINIA